MLELIYATIRKIQLGHPEGSPRIEAIFGVCCVLAPVCYAVLALCLPIIGIDTNFEGNARKNPIYWVAIMLSVVLAWLLFDRRIPAIDLKYESLPVSLTFIKKVPWIILFLFVSLVNAFLAFRWPAICLGGYAVLEFSVGRAADDWLRNRARSRL